MALTSEEESKVRSIIEAFENGKRLADLPEVEGTNPFELLCEVLDTDGESKKAALATFMPYLEENCAYGIEYDVAVSSPECTRIGNMELHKSLPIQSRMKGCLLADDVLPIGEATPVTVHVVKSWWNFQCTTASSRPRATSAGSRFRNIPCPAIIR